MLLRQTPVPIAPKLLTPEEAAASLRVSIRKVRRWIQLQEIDVVRIGRSVRIPMAELDRIIREHTEHRAKIWADTAA